jgi:protocatechuate 3,4-dioxygenase, beta subunit
MGTEFIDANPDYDFEDYELSRFRAPQQKPIEVPAQFSDTARGPAFGCIPVGDGENDLTNKRHGMPIGERIFLHGFVLSRRGDPIPGSLVEIWQVNAAGRYADPADPGFFPLDPNFIGAGRCVTGEDGSYGFTTIRPAPYAGRRSFFRPAHIHVSVFGTDLASRLITQCYFEGDPLIDDDPIPMSVLDEAGRDGLIAKVDREASFIDGGRSALAYRWDIVLRGSDSVRDEQEAAQ